MERDFATRVADLRLEGQKKLSAAFAETLKFSRRELRKLRERLKTTKRHEECSRRRVGLQRHCDLIDGVIDKIDKALT